MSPIPPSNNSNNNDEAYDDDNASTMAQSSTPRQQNFSPSPPPASSSSSSSSLRSIPSSLAAATTTATVKGSENPFLGADASRLILVQIIVTYIMFGYIIGGGGTGGEECLASLGLDHSKIINNYEYYRYFTYHLTFGTAAELLIGGLVFIPLCKKYEREMSTGTMIQFLYGKVLPLATIFHVAFLWASKSVLWESSSSSMVWESSESLASSSFVSSIVSFFIHNNNESLPPPPGPYPQLGALLYLFHKHSPRLHVELIYIPFLNIHLSDKAPVYFTIFWLMLRRSLTLDTYLPLLFGILAGKICTDRNCNMVVGAGGIGKQKSWVDWKGPFPVFICNFFGRFIDRLGWMDHRFSMVVPVVSPMMLPVLNNGVNNGSNNRRNQQQQQSMFDNNEAPVDPLVAALAASLAESMATQQPPPTPRTTNTSTDTTSLNNHASSSEEPSTNNTTVVTVDPPPPKEEDVQILIDMGFHKDIATQVLTDNGGNVEQAANRLLEG